MTHPGGLWAVEDFRQQLRFSLRIARTIHSERSAYQQIDVVETLLFGRALLLDGIYMTSEGDEFFYHEMLVHPALVTHPRPRRVLVIGGGDGGTVREVLRHPEVETVRMVEIDPRVVEVSREHLPTIGTAWDDPRLELRFEDGVAYVQRAEDPPWDVVILDGSDPVGPAEGLFSRDFYLGVRRVLAPGGLFALQSESPVLFPDVFQAIQGTAAEVFGAAYPCFGHVPIYGASQWTWTLALTDGTDPREPRHPERAEALEANGGTRYYTRAIHAASFVVPPYARPHG